MKKQPKYKISGQQTRYAETIKEARDIAKRMGGWNIQIYKFDKSLGDFGDYVAHEWVSY